MKNVNNHKKSSSTTSLRIRWLDMLKAFAVFLIPVAHKTDNAYIELVIFSFLMPLFFWMSGFVFDQSRYKDFKTFLIRKTKTLLVPYFVFAFCSFLFWFLVVRSLSIRGQSLSQDPLQPFWGIFYGVGVDPWRNPLDITLWFLPCLFVAEIFYWFICDNFKGTFRTIVVILFLIGGYCTTIWMPFRWPWSADVALTAVLFYYAGNLARRMDEKLDNINIGWKIFLICLTGTIMLLLSKCDVKADLNYNHYGNPVLFIITAFSGIYFSYLLVRKIYISRIISYVGQNTIIFIGLGGVSSFFIRGIFYIVTGSVTSGKIGIIETIIYSCLEICLFLPVMYIINRYFPFILGRKR